MFINCITMTLTATELDMIRKSLRYGAEQAQTSDIAVYEIYESRDSITNAIIYDEALFEANKVKAVLALKLADTLDLIEGGATLTLTATELDMIRKALRYSAEQALSSDIAVYEDTDMYEANKAKANLAIKMANTLDCIAGDNDC